MERWEDRRTYAKHKYKKKITKLEKERQKVLQYCCNLPMDEYGICWACNECERIVMKNV